MRTPRQEYQADPKPNMRISTTPSGKYVGICASRFCILEFKSHYKHTKYCCKPCCRAEWVAVQDDKNDGKEEVKAPLGTLQNRKEADKDSLSSRWLRVRL